MPIVEANGICIGYERAGQGRDIVLVTGLGYGRWFWHRLAPILARRYCVLTFDNRGAGETDKPPGPYTLRMMAADTAALMDVLGIERAIVFGHSLGGLIAQELIHARPALVARLILGATMHGGPKGIPVTPEALAVMAEIAAAAQRGVDPAILARKSIMAAVPPGFAEAHPELVQELVDYRLTNPVPPPQYQAQMQAAMGAAAMAEEEVNRRLASIAVPTLVLDAEHDLVLPNLNGRLLAAKIPGAVYTRLEGCGHRYPFEAAEPTAAALFSFCG